DLAPLDRKVSLGDIHTAEHQFLSLKPPQEVTGLTQFDCCAHEPIVGDSWAEALASAAKPQQVERTERKSEGGTTGNCDQPFARREEGLRVDVWLRIQRGMHVAHPVVV